MTSKTSETLNDDGLCTVVGGTHKEKPGTVKDIHTRRDAWHLQ